MWSKSKPEWLKFFFLPSFFYFYFTFPVSAVDCEEAKGTLNVSLLIFSVEQRNAFEEIAANFSAQCPGIDIVYSSSDDTGYKQMTELWLSDNPHLDLMVWLWPVELKKVIENGLIEPLTSLWTEPELQKYPNEIKELITHGGEQFGVPLSVGFWGFFANQSVLQEFEINRIENINDLLSACRTLSRNQIVPIGLGLQEQWPVLALFDYLNLKVNGLSFHNQLLEGNIKFTDKKVLAVLELWRELIDNQCFLKNADEYTQKQVLPLLYRDRAGMVLSGNFMISQIPEAVSEKLKFIPFPFVDKNVSQSEIAPTDFLILLASSRKKSLAKVFLRYVVQDDVQALLNKRLNFLPAHPNAKISDVSFVQHGSSNLKKAEGVVQFFDRSTSRDYYQPLSDILVDFMETGKVDKAALEMEAVRQRLFDS
jgi:multiple sugar transport system substrate-binding protein